jgi:hypothetical protein
MLALSAPKNTLRHHLGSRPLTRSIDFSGITFKDFVKRVFTTKDHLEKTDSPFPESEALRFYFLNHMMADLRARRHLDEPLTSAEVVFVERYYKDITEASARMATYVFLICCREMRHIHSHSLSDKFKKEFVAKFGQDLLDFIYHLTSHGESNVFGKMKNTTLDIPLGTYISGLTWAFNNGPFNGGYGGPAWGKVSQAVEDYIWGRISAEILLDIGWTLAHNNGPIFNKGYLYKQYSNMLGMILDIQRAGQIPQAFAEYFEDHKNTKYTMANYLPALQEYYAMALNLFPDAGWAEANVCVDWWAVQSAGALHGCGAQKAGQKFKPLPAVKGKPKEVTGDYYSLGLTQHGNMAQVEKVVHVRAPEKAPPVKGPITSWAQLVEDPKKYLVKEA